jgi:hypothetical protein
MISACRYTATNGKERFTEIFIPASGVKCNMAFGEISAQASVFQNFFVYQESPLIRAISKIQELGIPVELVSRIRKLAAMEACFFESDESEKAIFYAERIFLKERLWQIFMPVDLSLIKIHVKGKLPIASILSVTSIAQAILYSRLRTSLGFALITTAKLPEQEIFYNVIKSIPRNVELGDLIYKYTPYMVPLLRAQKEPNLVSFGIIADCWRQANEDERHQFQIRFVTQFEGFPPHLNKELTVAILRIYRSASQEAKSKFDDFF